MARTTQLTAVLMQADHYKLTSDKPMEDGSKQTFTVGYHQTYREACESAETLSMLMADTPVRVYRYSANDRNYVQESYYLNGQ